MSSDEKSINNDQEVVSDNEQQTNDILIIDENLQDQDEQTEEVLREETAEGEGAGEDEKTTVKPKRTIRNPQPKLNEERLKGPKGIAALESYFERVKFKGKGKEHEDLNVIMKTYEYWCHRLFPKFPFDTCIERLEKLGSKRAVQTHIKRIRFDLFVEDKPILDDSDEEPNVEGFVDIENDEINHQQNQQFDQLLGSSALAPASTPVELTEEQLERIRLNKEKANHQQNQRFNQLLGSSALAPASTPVELTEQQLERIRLNKEKAERLKQERLNKIRDKAEKSIEVSSQLPGTSGLQSETRLEQFEGTQSELFSQEDYVSVVKSSKNSLDVLDNREALFDHESSIKGKASRKGASIKKKSRKRAFILNSDSEKSGDELVEVNIQNKDVLLSTKKVSDDMDILGIDQNSSDSGFAPKKRKKLNTILDSDDEQNDDEETKRQNDRSRSESLESATVNNGNSDDENFVEFNISVKNLPNECTLLNTEIEPVVSDTHDLDGNHDDQEMEMNDINTANSPGSNGLNKQSLDSLGHKPHSSLEISSLAKNGFTETDNLVEVPKTIEVDSKPENNHQSIEFIEGELEAVLKSTQDTNYINSLKSNNENKENSTEDNVI